MQDYLLEHALKYYRSAKNAWDQVVIATEDIYTEDITFGYKDYMGGHWADRVQGIEEDIKSMEKQIHLAKENASIG